MDKGSVKTRAASTKPQADCLPALATNDGQVVMDAAAQARRIGLSAGCAVLVESDKREAVFLQLCEGGAEVRFVQVAEDGAAQESVRIVPLAELAVLPKGDTKKPKAVRVVDTRQPGTEWSLMTYPGGAWHPRLREVYADAVARIFVPRKGAVAMA